MLRSALRVKGAQVAARSRGLWKVESGKLAMDASYPCLGEMIARIREAVDPDRIVLFGSRARGQARPESDFDLLIIKESDQPRHRRAASCIPSLRICLWKSR